MLATGQQCLQPACWQPACCQPVRCSQLAGSHLSWQPVRVAAMVYLLALLLDVSLYEHWSRSELVINSQVSLVVTQDGSNAYLKAGSEQAILPNKKELFSFGSGMWCDGSDATQAMNAGGSWLKCQVGLSSMVVLEKKKIPSHLAELPCLDKAVSMKELLQHLEDQGEAAQRPVLIQRSTFQDIAMSRLVPALLLAYLHCLPSSPYKVLMLRSELASRTTHST